MSSPRIYCLHIIYVTHLFVENKLYKSYWKHPTSKNKMIQNNSNAKTFVNFLHFTEFEKKRLHRAGGLTSCPFHPFPALEPNTLGVPNLIFWKYSEALAWNRVDGKELNIIRRGILRPSLYIMVIFYSWNQFSKALSIWSEDYFNKIYIQNYKCSVNYVREFFFHLCIIKSFFFMI